MPPDKPSAVEVQRRAADNLRATAMTVLRRLAEMEGELIQLDDPRVRARVGDLLHIAVRAGRGLHHELGAYHRGLEERADLVAGKRNRLPGHYGGK